MDLDFSSPLFWSAVLKIIAIDIVLSGDNAVVIALACRNLPPAARRRGILWGVSGAVGLRVLLTAVTALLLGLPWLKLGGGLLLLWIGVKLLQPEDEEGPAIEGAGNLWGAVRTIILADFVMSLDNVIGVAGVAGDSLALLLFGLAVSIPLIVFSSQALLHLMERFPLIVTLGAGLMGWVAGGMIASDPGLAPWVATLPAWTHTAAAVIGALGVVVVGHLRARRHPAAERAVL